MSDKEKLTGLIVFTVTLWAVWACNLIIDHARFSDYEKRLQALEQNSCIEKQHAAYRFKLCQDQLRERQ